MIRSCDYCFAVFDETYWSWCILKNDIDDSSCTLCSCCASEIFFNQEEQKMEWIIDRKDKQDEDAFQFLEGFAYKKRNLPESKLEGSFFVSNREEDAHIAKELNQILKLYFEARKSYLTY